MAFAQSETVDIISFQIPRGWNRAVKDRVVKYSFRDTAKNNYCSISIYPATPTSGTTTEDFNKQWIALVATPLKIYAVVGVPPNACAHAVPTITERSE